MKERWKSIKKVINIKFQIQKFVKVALNNKKIMNKSKFILSYSIISQIKYNNIHKEIS